MKTEIYYFSGSGNSLNIAQNLSKNFEHSKLISIPHIMNKAIDITGDVIGIVCPIYFRNMPYIVRNFVMKIKKAKYTFMVYAGAGDLGTAGVRTTKKLFSTQGIKLSSLFNIPMPDNSTKYGEILEEEQKKMFNNADKKIKELVKIVNRKEEHFDHNNTSLFQTYIHPGILYSFLYGSLQKMDKDFTANEDCIGCSTCQKVCPTNNITMKDNKPVWKKNNKCQVCLACHDWCPKEAILHPSTKAGVKRYHNPNITVKRIISSSAEV